MHMYLSLQLVWENISSAETMELQLVVYLCEPNLKSHFALCEIYKAEYLISLQEQLHKVWSLHHCERTSAPTFGLIDHN